MKKVIIALFVCFSIVFNTNADHFAGAELTYECISTSGATSDYVVSLTIYRDCSGEDLAEF